MLFTVPGPHIITHPTDTSAAAPFSGVFTCSASGYGTLSIYWMKENSDLPTKSFVMLSSSPEVINSTLVIPNVTESDVDQYYCIVWADDIKASKSHAAQLSFSGIICIIYVLPLVMRMIW